MKMTNHKQVSRKELKRLAAERKRNAVPFIGTCSNCGDKRVPVVKFKSAQVCTLKCLPLILKRLSGSLSGVEADKVITA